MPGAELSEALRNRLLRRVDWRYLLPIPTVAKAICLADGDLGEGVALIAAQVVPSAAEAGADCDLAVAVDPDVATLRALCAALQSGGAFYGEWHGGVAGGIRAIAQRLGRAGFAQVRAYLPWRSSSRPHVWIPLDSPAALTYFRRDLHARSAGRMLAARVARVAVTRAARAGLLGPLCFVARKPGGPGSEQAMSHLVDGVRRSWASWGLEGEPVDLAMMLLTGGPRTSSKIAGLVFAGGESRPQLVVKIARVAEARAGLLREATTLSGLQSRCGGRLRGLPRVLFTADDGTMVAVGETALAGVPLLGLLNRHNCRAYGLLATDWMTELAGCARGEDRGRPVPEVTDEAVTEFARSFGAVIEPELLARTTAILEPLGKLPRACEHRDFAPWNVFVAPDGTFAVFDWESSEPTGLPGVDLLYFLTYLAFAIDHAKATPAMLQSYRAAMDPSSFTGAVLRECMARYAGHVGLVEADWHPLRLLTWIIHSRSEYRRLAADAGGPPAVDALRNSLFLGLWRMEALRGSHSPAG